MEATIAQELQARKATDFLPINGTDHLELYVGNAKQAAHFYKTAFGFQTKAYAGPETGVRDRVSYVLQQGKDSPRAHHAAQKRLPHLRAHPQARRRREDAGPVGR